MLFAETTTTDWVAIIAAVFLGLSQLFQMYLSHQRNQENKAKAEEAKVLLKENTKVTYELEKKVDDAINSNAGK